jgi:D-alanine-D-alanine ligase
MMAPKIRVGILFGGKSAEHEVSLQSAKNVVEALDKDKYEVVLIGIDKHGRWHLNTAGQFLLHSEDPEKIALGNSQCQVALVTGAKGSQELVDLSDRASFGKLDVIFPVLHGTYGEDGTVQGLLKLANIAFVGADVLGSAVSMDKDVSKRLLRDAGIAIADFVVINNEADCDFSKISAKLGLPLFVKPANLGSSVGIHKVNSASSLRNAVQDAFRYDDKVIIEAFISGREIECSVLGNEKPIASVPGEIVPKHEFYSYEAKYIDAQGAILEIPAKLPATLAAQIQALSISVYKVLCCEGMARVDLFLTPDEKLIVNEINTIPGFTKISMYPKLWEHTGISYGELIDKLIELALQRFERQNRLQTSYDL